MAVETQDWELPKMSSYNFSYAFSSSLTPPIIIFISSSVFSSYDFLPCLSIYRLSYAGSFPRFTFLLFDISNYFPHSAVFYYEDVGRKLQRNHSTNLPNNMASHSKFVWVIILLRTVSSNLSCNISYHDGVFRGFSQPLHGMPLKYLKSRHCRLHFYPFQFIIHLLI